ncbi:MAG: hypothetical protein IPM82_18400 [Saprospiraceae bacterium]|nr:hypothetical protein [Saprospiraceae bacterium]
MLLQNPVAEAPSGGVDFEEVSSGHFVQEMDEAQVLPHWQSFNSNVPIGNRHHSPGGQCFPQVFKMLEHGFLKMAVVIVSVRKVMTEEVAACNRHETGEIEVKSDDGLLVLLCMFQ